jgi:hypothetical protein
MESLIFSLEAQSQISLMVHLFIYLFHMMQELLLQWW